MYWSTHGPSILAAGWVTVHPHISLQKLQASIQSLEYLTHTMDQLGLAGDGDHVTDGVMSHASAQGAAAREEEGISEQVMQETANVVGADSCGDEDGKDPYGNVTICGAEEIELNGLSDDDLSNLWNAHYNNYYWYLYQTFCAEQESERTDEVIFLAEEEREASECTKEDGAEEEERTVVEGDGGMVGGVEIVDEMVGGVEVVDEMVGGEEGVVVSGVECDGAMVRGVEVDSEMVRDVEGDGSAECVGDVEVELAKMLVDECMGNNVEEEVVTGAPSMAAEPTEGEGRSGGKYELPSQQREEEGEAR